MKRKIKIFTVICCFIFGISIVKSQDAMDLIVEGNSLNNENNYTAALEKFKAALKIDKDNYLAQFGLGYAHFRLNNFDTALVNFQKVQKFKKNFEKAFYYSGVIRYNLKKYARAVFDFDRVLEINKKNFEAVQYRALALEKAGYFYLSANDYKYLSYKNDTNRHYYLKGCINRSISYKWYEAIFEFNELIKIAKDFDSVYFYQGRMYLQNDSTAEAYKCFTKAIELNKNFTEAYIYRGRAKQKMDSTIEENDDLRIWKTINLEYTKQELENAYNHFYEQEYNMAIEHFNNAIASDSNQKEALYSLADCYNKSSFLKKSERAIDITISKFPEKWDSYLLKAEIYISKLKNLINEQRNKDYQSYYVYYYFDPSSFSTNRVEDMDVYIEALTYIDTIKKLIKIVYKNDPMNLYAHLVRARFLIVTNAPKEALSELNYLIEQSPEMNYYLERFMFYYNKENYKKALSDLEKVIEIQGNTNNFKIEKAMIMYYLGKKEKSIEILDSLWEDEINQDEVYLCRGKYHFFCNKDYHSAIRDFTSALEINPYYSEVYLLRAVAKWNIEDITGRDEDIKLYNRTNR